MKLTRLLFLIMLFAANKIAAQMHNFKLYGLDDGLSQSQVSAICQDKNGYIWIGTEGGGLNRFDGKEFRSFSMDDGLSSNMIWSLFCDSKGEIWIGTEKGITHYDGYHFNVIQSSLRINDVPVWDITEDHDGNVWFATGGLGAIRYNGREFKRFGINDGLGFGEVYKIYCDRHGRIWAGSNGFGVAFYTNEKFKNVTETFSLIGKDVNVISEDPNGQLIICTELAMQRFIGDHFVSWTMPGIRSSQVNNCVYDNKQNLWLSTVNQGVFRINNTDTTRFTDESGLASNYIISLFKDLQGNIWTGFDGAGCAVFRGDRFVYYNKTIGLPNNVAKCIAKNDHGGIWLGTENGLIEINNKEINQHEQLNQQLSSTNIHSLLQDGKKLWIGTEEGINLYHNGEVHVFNANESGTMGIAFGFYKGRNRLWLGCDDGVYAFDGEKFIKRFKDTLRDKRVYSIRELGKDEIWLCCDVGVSIYQEGKLKYLAIEDEYGELDVLDAWRDPIGNTWLITGRGLMRIGIDGSKEIYKKKNGLASDNLYLLQPDGEHLWIGSDNGLDKITPDNNWEVKSIRHYGKAAGFSGVETNFNASLIDDNGNIWFGSIKGVYCYLPANDELNTDPPLIKFNGLRLLYEKTDWRLKYPAVGNYIDMPENIVLRHSDNHLTFDFIAFDFLNPDKIKYQFYLENFDQNWLPVTHDNFATYSNLPPGSYTFYVKAANSDGYWSDPITYRFVIDAPFWKKSWFYFVLTPVLLLSFWLLLLRRTRKLNIDKRKLEEKVRLRTYELSLQKQELEKLSIVASKMNEAVFICDSEGNIEWINDSVIRMSGFTRESFKDSYLAKTKNIKELISVDAIRKKIEACKLHPESFIYDSPHKTPGGEIIWTRGSFVPITDQEGKLQKIIAIYTDITDHQNAEFALEKWKNDFTASVKYAKRIQEAILPPKFALNESFPDSFILHLPRDIVSGDFYWFAVYNNYFFWAVADCTGHGVPGAFMSLIGNEYLHQIIKNETQISGPEQILLFLDKKITTALHQEGEARESRDGLDIGLCVIRMDNLFCQFAGAGIPMIRIRNGEYELFDSVKESIGGYFDREKEFFSHETFLRKGDCLYMTSDGFPDQFGGEQGKKFMRKRLKELLLSIHHLPMSEQKIILDTEFAKWKGNHKQIDDVLVMGIRI